MNKYDDLVDVLMQHTASVLNYPTQQKLSLCKLFYAVMVRAIRDKQNKNLKHKIDAEIYLNSELFKARCNFVGVSEELMRLIINNPDKYVENMVYEP